MGKRKTPPKGVICAYCGGELTKQNATDEHVIPRCLFPKDRRHGLIKVWLCSKCNGAKAAVDDYFRDALITELGTDRSHVPHEVMAAFFRSAQENRSLVARAALAAGKIEPAFTPAGVYRGMGVAYDGQPERLMAASGWIARGLYYHKHQTLLPDGYEVHAGLINAELFLERVAGLSRMGVQPREMADGLARLYYATASEGGGAVTLAVLLLYDHVVVQIATMPRERPAVNPTVSKGAKTSLRAHIQFAQRTTGVI